MENIIYMYVRVLAHSAKFAICIRCEMKCSAFGSMVHKQIYAHTHTHWANKEANERTRKGNRVMESLCLCVQISKKEMDQTNEEKERVREVKNRISVNVLVERTHCVCVCVCTHGGVFAYLYHHHKIARDKNKEHPSLWVNH